MKYHSSSDSQTDGFSGLGRGNGAAILESLPGLQLTTRCVVVRSAESLGQDGLAVSLAAELLQLRRESFPPGPLMTPVGRGWGVGNGYVSSPDGFRDCADNLSGDKLADGQR